MNRNDVISEMNGIMSGIKTQRAQFLDAQNVLSGELELIRVRHEPAIEAMRDRLRQAEKTLLGLATQYRDALFPGDADRVDLAHGTVLRTIERHVTRVRGMLKKLDMLGRADLIKIAKSVDWDAVEKLDDVALAAIGTARTRKERFSYEII